ncbi:MAG: RNA 2',3'-cyclic phosphodiesterase [Nevskia sp.]
MTAPDDQLALFPDLPDAAKLRRSRPRLFFALWPDRALRAGIERAAALIPSGDVAAIHRVRPERYHLTLAFLGELDARQAEAALQAGDAVRAAAFEFVLDHVGHFEGANVAWIGPSVLEPALARLKAELDRELLHYRLPVASEPFVPHVSCLRKIRERPDAPPPMLRWPVSDFALVRSCRDAAGKPAGYKLLRRWPLLPA